MRRTVVQIHIVLISLVVLFLGCTTTPEMPVNNAITITDSLGRTITLATPPERIIIAGKANFMINDAVYLFPQAPDKVIGLTQARQGAQQFITLLDADYEEKARFTLDSSAEEIIAAQPDLVLLKSLMRQTLGDSLEQLNIPVAYMDLETPEGYKHDIAMLGLIFNDTERAGEVWRYYQTLLDTLEKNLADVSESDRPTVLLVQYVSSGGEEAFQIPPAAWIQTQMVELAGGAPVWLEAAQGNWAVVNFEQIAAWNPEHIYVLSYFEDPGSVVQALRADTKWQQLIAVQSDQLFGFPKDFYSWDQPDTRWSLGLTWLAAHIQPTRFPDLDITGAFYHFYEDLYGLDAETINLQIIPLVQGERITAHNAE